MHEVTETPRAAGLRARPHGAGAASVRWACWMAALCVLLAGCSRAPAEQRLREAMAGLQSAIEAREVRVAMGYVDEDFIGSGSLDREGARNLLRAMVLRHQSLGLTLGPAEIELFEGRATVRFTAVATGGQGALLPQSARVWQVETAWREDGSDWRLLSAHWD